MCFSVRHGITPPPSLRNIFRELRNDLGCKEPNHGCLECWAKQRVLLLNKVLTVRAHEAASHQKQGWEEFTDAVIRAVNARTSPVAFVLWGAQGAEEDRTGRQSASFDRQVSAPLAIIGKHWIFREQALLEGQRLSARSRIARDQLANCRCGLICAITLHFIRVIRAIRGYALLARVAAPIRSSPCVLSSQLFCCCSPR